MRFEFDCLGDMVWAMLFFKTPQVVLNVQPRLNMILLQQTDENIEVPVLPASLSALSGEGPQVSEICCYFPDDLNEG